MTGVFWTEKESDRYETGITLRDGRMVYANALMLHEDIGPAAPGGLYHIRSGRPTVRNGRPAVRNGRPAVLDSSWDGRGQPAYLPDDYVVRRAGDAHTLATYISEQPFELL